MRNERHRWYIPVVILVWALLCTAEAIQILIEREFEFRWTRGSESFFVRSDTHPFAFWISVLVVLTIGLASGGIGIALLRMVLQKPKKLGRPLQIREEHADAVRSNRFQSEEFREVCAHLTDDERRERGGWIKRAFLWMFFLVALGFGVMALQGKLRVILLAAWLFMLLASMMFGMYSLSKFYCSTAWAKAHGYSHKTFRFFAWPLSKRAK